MEASVTSKSEAGPWAPRSVTRSSWRSMGGWKEAMALPGSNSAPEKARQPLARRVSSRRMRRRSRGPVRCGRSTIQRKSRHPSARSTS